MVYVFSSDNKWFIFSKRRESNVIFKTSPLQSNKYRDSTMSEY